MGRAATGITMLMLAHAALAITAEPTFIVDGRATVINSDVLTAREEAIRTAVWQALTELTSREISAGTLIDKETLLARLVRTHTFGWTRELSVLSERWHNDQAVTKVSVTLAQTPVDVTLQQLLSKTTVVVLATLDGDNAAAQDLLVPVLIDDPVFTEDAYVPPFHFLGETAVYASPSFFHNPDPETLRAIGSYNLAELLLLATATTSVAESPPSNVLAHASGKIGLFDSRTGKLITVETFTDIVGPPAQDQEHAVAGALSLLAERMRSFATVLIKQRLDAVRLPLRVVVRGNQAADGANAVRQLLESTRWVRSVELVASSALESKFLLSCRELPLYVVEQLRASDTIRVLQYQRNRGEVVVR